MPITRKMDPDVFVSSYWLKEDLVSFCRKEGLPASGSKSELTERIHIYLSGGAVVVQPRKSYRCASNPISLDSPIGRGFTCSQEKRRFFEEHIGKGFRFSVPFQEWLKSHPDATYADAVREYPNVRGDGTIAPQFEYNTYIRDFFSSNPGRTLDEAIKCWNYRKSQRGSHRYSDEDLVVLGNGTTSVE